MRLGRIRSRPRVVVSHDALDKLTHFSEQAYPMESGGLLLGYRVNTTILILDAVAVHDPDATAASFTRRERAAQVALDNALAAQDELVGYVGDWHSHPMPASPSKTDRRSLRRASRQYEYPIALVVVTGTDGDYHTLHALVANGVKTKVAELEVGVSDVATRRDRDSEGMKGL